MDSLSERAQQGFQRFGVDVTTRVCGACVACCTYVGVAKLEKPKGVHCKHELEGGGCAIYMDRPPECAAWYCAWRMGYGDEGDRPDRAGFVLGLGNAMNPASVILTGPGSAVDLAALRRVFVPALGKRLEITSTLATCDAEANVRFVLDAPDETAETMRVWPVVLMLPDDTLRAFLAAAIAHLKAGGTGDDLMDSPEMPATVKAAVLTVAGLCSP